MANLIRNTDEITTAEAVKFYEQYKDSFGEAIKADMKGKKCILTLFNATGDEMIFDGGLSAGYSGEGPSGTLKVLETAGFKITREFIKMNTDFTLDK
jgi:hypothetical protein